VRNRAGAVAVSEDVELAGERGDGAVGRDLADRVIVRVGDVDVACTIVGEGVREVEALPLNARRMLEQLLAKAPVSTRP